MEDVQRPLSIDDILECGKDLRSEDERQGPFRNEVQQEDDDGFLPVLGVKFFEP
jgi:hypothetical protein